MTKLKNSKKRQQQADQPSAVVQYFRARGREVSFILLVAVAVYLLIALCTYHSHDPSWTYATSTAAVQNAGGAIGAWLSDVMLYCLGLVAYCFPLLLFVAGWRLYQHRHELEARSVVVTLIRALGFVVAILSMAGLVAVHYHQNAVIPYHPGGILGLSVAKTLIHLLGVLGATCLLVMALFISLVMYSGFSFFQCLEKVGNAVVYLGLRGYHLLQVIPLRQMYFELKSRYLQTQLLRTEKQLVERVKTRPKQSIRREPSVQRAEADLALPPVAAVKPASMQTVTAAPKSQGAKNVVNVSPASHSLQEEGEVVQHVKVNMKVIPEFSLLNQPKPCVTTTQSEEVLHQQALEVEQRLADFGVTATVTAICPGPVVTRYEIDLAAGTKVSKVSNLAKDLARSLSVMSVRVVEVIPGKSVIGLELPNPNRQSVVLREVLESKAYDLAKSKLSIALGKDIAGNAVVVDLAKMPHLLVAGTTGSGKSVSLNAMLLSLLYKATPEQMRMILIDPKMLELAVYEGIPHLLTPVVTDMRDAAKALRWCVAEMERRYHLMATLGVRNLAGFNAKILEARQKGKPIFDPLINSANGLPAVELQPLPQIVVLADEFADMMVVVGKKVETLIARLAQKARAAGIHLILATQRPSVDVITGLIKANIPTRIAFQVSSKIDSRTILDQQGAEQLLGNGDMLYLAPGTGVPIRVHGAFVSDEEVHAVVKYLCSQSGPSYSDEVLSEPADMPAGGAQTDWVSTVETECGEKDELYDQAVEMVMQSRRVSVSSIQRRFKIGYNRAARIVDSMEMAGVVSSMETNGMREVLLPKSE